jgi:tRNA-specific 2-thiouridylase
MLDMKSQAKIKARNKPRKRTVGGAPPDSKRGSVFVGMSGGVDSSVSAALLKKAGYDVTGVFIKVWQPDWLECTWREDRRDAMRVAAHLDIPFVTLDLEKEYKKDVVDYMIAEYRAGRTPNPDVMCNKSVKFGAFYDWAMKKGADFVATGHYAQVIREGTSSAFRSKKQVLNTSSIFNVHTAKDSNKDQSYFIYNLKQEQLAHILFPIGHLDKPDVRIQARKFKLPNADKKDSQGLCFIGHVDMKEFLSHYIESKPGNVLNERGQTIGTHPGALFFTIGERHGFTVSQKTPHDEPYFVIAKDMAGNTITVAQHAPVQTETKRANAVSPTAYTRIKIINTNWINQIPVSDTQFYARARYRQALEKAVIVSVNKNEACVDYAGSPQTISPGQCLVLYDGSVCIGGGIIA